MGTSEAGTAPMAFISHASEDKARFAEPLARALYQQGIRAWLDKWEMQPGDSVISKIFDEGIARADCFVVIVSEHSITKPWVREELDSGMVERINRSCRLIPIRLGEVEMPPPLRATIWIDAVGADEAAAITAADEIARVLHGHDPRPGLGQPAPYLALHSSVAGLAADESLLLIRLAEAAIASGHLLPGMNWHELLKAVAADGIPEASATEAAHALDHASYVELTGAQRGILRLQLTSWGFAAALPTLQPDWQELRARIIAELVNDPPTDVAGLAERVDVPPLVVHHFVDELRDEGLLNCSHYLGGNARIHGISPALRRLAQ
jgi:TIR domain